MDAIALARDRDGPFHRRPHAETIDVGHGERGDASLLDVVALAGVHVAQAEQHTAVAARRTAKVRGERVTRESERDGERHPVHVPRRRGLGRVDVAVRVDPDDAGLLPRPGEAGERAHRYRVVPAEDEGDVACAHDLRDDGGELLTRADDLGHVVRARPACRPLPVVLLVRVRRETFIRIGDADVPTVPHAESDVRQLRHEASVANPGRTHVDAAPVATQVHRHPDDLDDRTRLHPAGLLGIGLAHVRLFPHGAGCFGATAERGWKIAWMTPSAATSSPT
jgi:hypothetical protein